MILDWFSLQMAVSIFRRALQEDSVYLDATRIELCSGGIAHNQNVSFAKRFSTCFPCFLWRTKHMQPLQGWKGTNILPPTLGQGYLDEGVSIHFLARRSGEYVWYSPSSCPCRTRHLYSQPSSRRGNQVGGYLSVTSWVNDHSTLTITFRDQYL